MSVKGPHIQIDHEDRQVWRVGHRPEPWAWAPWRYAVDGRFDGRWDDPEGAFRTMYAGESLLGCLLEVLACFRPDPALTEGLDDIEDNDPASESAPPPGTVPRSWLERRCAATSQMKGRFCAVSHSRTVSALRPVFLDEARSFGLEDFDTAALRDPRPRGLTQRIAAHLWHSTDLDGVRYASRHGDDHMLWAIFERPDDGDIASCLTTLSIFDLAPEGSSIIEAFEIHSLSWEEIVEEPPLPLPLVEANDDEEEAKARQMFGDEGPTLRTPLGAAALFQLAMDNPSYYQMALEQIVWTPDAWGDYADAQYVASLGMAEYVMDSTDDPRIKHVKFVPLSSNNSVIAFARTPLPDLSILTVVNIGHDHDEWRVWGLSKNSVPTGAQVRGESPSRT